MSKSKKSHSKSSKKSKQSKGTKNGLSKKLTKFKFEKDWRPTIWVCLLLSPLYFALIGIPFAIYFVLKNYFTQYEIDENMLIKNSGIIFKKNQTYDLYQIKNVSAQNDLFRGGYLIITMQDKEVNKLPYIKNTSDLLPLLRDVSHSARSKQRVYSHEVM